MVLLATFNIVVSITMQIRVISDPLEVGTRVHWDQPTQSLYYVDVPTSYVYKYEESTRKTTRALVGSEPLGFAFPVEGNNNQFIAASGRKFILFNWDGNSNEVTNIAVIAEVDKDKPNNRLNGGKVDPSGRLWAGTMGPTDKDGNTIPGQGSLFCVDKGTVRQMDTNIGISNGLAWDVDKKKMYYIDTMFLGIYQYNYEPATGTISDRKVIFNFSGDSLDGKPDGLTIDTEGNLWVAMIYGHRILKIDPLAGKLLLVINMPTAEVTAVSFGGKNVSTLFINTAKMPISGVEPDYPAGCTFSIDNVGSTGLPGDRYKK